MKKSYFIDSNNINTRIDRWIKKNIAHIPQSLVEKNLRKGKIKINNKKKKASYKLKINDKIDLYDLNFVQKKNKKKIYKATKREITSTNNLFVEDNLNFAVINKPAGLAVQSGTKSKRNLIDILRYTKEFTNYSPYTVHRIDKDTSGILVVAKNRKYAQLFTSLFRIRKIHKTYLSIVLGTFDKQKGSYVDNLEHYEGDEKITTKAITHYTVLDTNNNYSLLKLNPVTGRKHQLRKQLLIHGHPVLGDQKYRITSNYNKKNNNLMLHAYKINFSINGNKYKYLAEPPLIFKQTLKEKYLKIYQL